MRQNSRQPMRGLGMELGVALTLKVVALTWLYFTFFAGAPQMTDSETHLFGTGTFR